jgi:hypothetical protein
VARLDWNRDGREDLIVANQYSPAQLLTNNTPAIGRSLVFQFRATATSRDAIGTILQLKCGTRTIERQLTAGDGYMASNERQIVIAVDAAEKIETLSVFWPSGFVQTLTASDIREFMFIVEQRPPLALE